LSRLQLSLLGRHQRDNAALALACVMLLRQCGWNVPETAIRVALAELEIPCRVERLKLPKSQAPTVIIDGAHNKASAEALLEALRGIVRTQQTGRKILLFGSAFGKDVARMFEVLLLFFDELWLSQCSTSPRAMPVDALQILAQNTDCKPPIVSGIASPDVAAEQIRQTTNKNDLVCVTGSLYFAAEMRKFLLCPNP